MLAAPLGWWLTVALGGAAPEAKLVQAAEPVPPVLPPDPVPPVLPPIESSPLVEEPSEPRAQPLQLTWEAHADCGDAASIAEQVSAVVLDPEQPTERFAPLAVVGTVERTADDRWRSTLRFESGEARVIEADDCAALVEGAVAVLAIAAEEAAQPHREATAPPEPDPEYPPVEDNPIPAPPQPRKRPRRIQVAGRPMIGLGLGITSGATPGVSFVGALQARRLRVQLGVSHWFARQVDLPGEGLGAQVQVTYGDARLCFVPRRRRLEMPVCAGVGVGGARARGQAALESAVTAWRLWVGALGSVGLAIRLGRNFAAVLDSIVVIPTVRPGFRVDGATQELWRAPQVGWQALIGLEVRTR